MRTNRKSITAAEGNAAPTALVTTLESDPFSLRSTGKVEVY